MSFVLAPLNSIPQIGESVVNDKADKEYCQWMCKWSLLAIGIVTLPIIVVLAIVMRYIGPDNTSKYIGHMYMNTIILDLDSIPSRAFMM
jgi:hypothetical protein